MAATAGQTTAWGPIVVGVDGSPESRRALELASQIAAAEATNLVPVYVVPDLWPAGAFEQVAAIAPEVYDTLVRDARQQIERFVAEALPPASRPRVEVRTGPAATAIAEVAREQRAGLVVLGGKHHAALVRGLGRRTAHYLVRTLDIPLLVVGSVVAPTARVLAAVDLSSASLPTIRAAERFALLLGARLRVIHVVEPLRLMYLPVGPLDQQGFNQRSGAAFARLMKLFQGIAPEDRVVRTGLAAETLAEEVASWQADLLVVGSHGKGWIDRLLLGSTSERLLNVLPTSLLVVPTAPRRKRHPQRSAPQPKPKRKPRRRKP